jgi:hypothetical protein
MIIANDQSDKENPRPQKKKTSKLKLYNGFVLPEQEIRDFAGNIWAREAESIFIRLTIVDHALSRQVEGKLDPADLKLIKAVAELSKARRYSKVMRAIVRAAESGQEGIEAARKSLGKVLGFMERLVPHHKYVLQQYAVEMRRIKRKRRPVKRTNLYS